MTVHLQPAQQTGDFRVALDLAAHLSDLFAHVKLRTHPKLGAADEAIRYVAEIKRGICRDANKLQK